MAAEGWQGMRCSFLGQPIRAHLAAVLGSADKVVLVASRSASDEHVELLGRAAARSFAAVLRPLGAVDRNEVDRLRRALTRVRPDAVVAIGGGTILDTAKALACPQSRLVLVPTTLSGSEQTANASWWDHGRKVVAKVGMADVVIADPELVVPRLDVLGPGALHALAHSLATLVQSDPMAGSSPRAIVTAAAADLVAALRRRETDVPARALFQRGAWNAAVGFGLTGPRIGPHHLLVHRLSLPGEHARVSSRLLCATLLQTGVYAQALEQLERAAPGFRTKVMCLAEQWAPQVADDPPPQSAAQARSWEHGQYRSIDELSESLPPSMALDAQVMLRALELS